MTRLLAFALLLLAPFAPARAQAAEPLTRERILETARAYADFEWQGEPRNVLHGPDPNGTSVDTPDTSFDPKGWRTDGTANHGMPYAWGGFTSIDEFRAGLAQGLPAGHVPKDEHVQASAYTLGLDCSGFVARAWDLPVKQSTRSLGALCYPLPGYEALQPGDILNLFDGHVVIFDRWMDDGHVKLSVYEAARLAVTASVYTASKLEAAGFQPMRYKPLDERWVPMELRDERFALPLPDAVKGGAFTQAEAAGAPSLALADVGSPMADARPLEWARYVVIQGAEVETGDQGGPAATGMESDVLVAASEGGSVDLQTNARIAGKTLSTGNTCEHPDVLLDALLALMASDEPLTGLEVRESRLTRGEYALGERRFPAVHVELELAGTRTMRHQDFPVTLALDAVIAEEVPVAGVLEAKIQRETVWSTEPRQVGVQAWWLRLAAFGG